MSTNEEIIPYFDYTFRILFIDSLALEPIQLKNMEELKCKIARYELESNTRLRLHKYQEENNYCQYKCASHKNCTFKATFGPKGANNIIVLKANYLYHTVKKH